MLVQCGASVADGGPALNHHWINVAHLAGIRWNQRCVQLCSAGLYKFRLVYLLSHLRQKRSNGRFRPVSSKNEMLTQLLVDVGKALQTLDNRQPTLGQIIWRGIYKERGTWRNDQSVALCRCRWLLCCGFDPRLVQDFQRNIFIVLASSVKTLEVKAIEAHNYNKP